MKTTLVWKLSAGAGLGFAAVAACAGAPPQDVGRTPDDALAQQHDAEQAAKRASMGDAGPAGSNPTDAGPGCPYGALEDPHRGFVRCLGASERDAGFQPMAPETPNAQDDAGVSPPSTSSSGPPSVEVGAPKFESGEVPKIEKILAKSANDVAACVADNGGLSGASGSMKVQFLVRPRGRAEGVEVKSGKGVSEAAMSCVRTLFKNKQVGAPTADPTGVTVTFTLKPSR
jgi:hypothetical protein